jgi:hypothetical protein
VKSTVVKRSIVLAGHSIDIDREHANLSSAIRPFVLGHYQKRAASGWAKGLFPSLPVIDVLT